MKKFFLIVPLIILCGAALPGPPTVNLPAPKASDNAPAPKASDNAKGESAASPSEDNYFIRPERWGARADSGYSKEVTERNRAAIQAAIDYRKGGRVQLSAGTYVISGTIYLRNDVSLCGVDPVVRSFHDGASAIFLQSFTGGPMIQAKSGGAIQGLLLCPGSQNTKTIGIYADAADHVHNLTVDGCYFSGFKGTPDTMPLLFEVLNQSRLTNNFFMDCNQSIQGYLMDSWITGNEATANKAPGNACMRLKGGNLVITENIIYGGQIGILADGLNGSVIAKNTFIDIGAAQFPGYGIAAMGGSSITSCPITGNFFGPNLGGGAGILLEKGTHNAIYGNVFDCGKTQDSAGVQLGRPGMVGYSDNDISGNVFGDVAVPLRIFPYPGKDPSPAGRLGVIKNNVGAPDQ